MTKVCTGKTFPDKTVQDKTVPDRKIFQDKIPDEIFSAE